MTNERICANETGPPALYQHIVKMHDVACGLDRLLQMVTWVNNEGKCNVDMSADLNNGLDSAVMPKVT
jgi:hypothetical protein